MELTKELTVERMPTQTTISLAEREGLEASELDERELNEKLIEILKERIDEGNTQARFQLGQLYFEKVNFNINIQIYNLYCIYKYTVYTVYIYIIFPLILVHYKQQNVIKTVLLYSVQIKLLIKN